MSSHNHHRLASASALLLAAGLLLGCAPAEAISPPPPAGHQAVEVLLSSSGDDIAFDKSALQATTTEPLALTFSNRATDHSSILHNVVVLKPGTEAAVLDTLHQVSYVLDGFHTDPRVLAMTRSLAPGETETLTIRFPAPGEYPFICLMPGHGDMMGMRGTIHVR